MCSGYLRFLVDFFDCFIYVLGNSKRKGLGEFFLGFYLDSLGFPDTLISIRPIGIEGNAM